MTDYSNVHEVHPNLFVGAQPEVHHDLSGRFEAVLDVSRGTSRQQRLNYEAHGIAYRSWPMDDGVVPPDEHGSLDEQVAWICDRIEEGRRVLVHCAMGVSRSATIAALFLMRTEGLSSTAALLHLQSMRPKIGPDERFITELARLDSSGAQSRSPV